MPAKKTTSPESTETKTTTTKKTKVTPEATTTTTTTEAPKAQLSLTGQSRLLDLYKSKIVKELQSELGYTSVMQVPRLDKIVINMGIGDAASNAKVIEEGVHDLRVITGQQPVTTKAKKAIAAFKLREGIPIGVKVTLRGVRMYDFLDKLFNIALPRVRDFRGLSKSSFDGRGNYSLGVREQLIFPEVKYEEITKTRGMDISIITTSHTDKDAYLLLSKLGLPFSR
jgi:large subunit ribosomal protein L5